MAQHFGDSDDKDVPLNIALGENMDDVRGDYPVEPGTFSMIYRRYNIWNYIFYIYVYYLLIILIQLTDPIMSGLVSPPNPPPPFDMVDFMHMSSSYDMNKVFRLAEDVPCIPRPKGNYEKQSSKHHLVCL